MEKLMLILLGLMILTLIKRKVELTNFRQLAFSTNSIGNTTMGAGGYSSRQREERPTVKKESPPKDENDDLNSLNEKQLAEEKSRLEKRLKKISKRLLSGERQKLQKRLEEIDAEIKKTE